MGSPSFTLFGQLRALQSPCQRYISLFQKIKLKKASALPIQAMNLLLSQRECSESRNVLSVRLISDKFTLPLRQTNEGSDSTFVVSEFPSCTTHRKRHPSNMWLIDR